MTNQTHLRAVERPRSVVSTGREPYTDAFKADAVQRLRAGQPIAQVSRDLGVARNTLKSWLQSPGPAGAKANGGIAAAARSGSRKAVLMALRDEIAASIEAGMSPRDLPVNARLLNETMLALDAIRAAEEQDREDPRNPADEPWEEDQV